MEFPNLAWALEHRKVVYMEASAVLRMSAGSFSQKMAGRVPFAPHERTRLSEMLGYRADWLFQPMVVPPEARLAPVYEGSESQRLDNQIRNEIWPERRGRC
jgi:hypothetical protein